MAGEVTTSVLTNAITEPALKNVFLIGYENAKRQSIHSRIYNVDEARFRTEKILTVGSFARFPKNSEGQNINTLDLNEAYKTSMTQQRFDGGFVITLEVQEFELYGLVKDMTHELSLAAAESDEYWAFEWLNNCTDATNYPLANGQALLSTAHPLSGTGAGTFANKPTTDVDIDVSTLEDALYYYDSIPDEQGYLGNRKKEPGLIVANSLDRPRILKILQANNVAFEISNTPNVIKTAWNIDVAFTTKIDDTDKWFLLPKRIQYNHKLWGKHPEIRMTNQENTWNKLVQCVYFDQFGFSDPRDVYGSTGGA